MATRMSIDNVLQQYKKRRDNFQIKSDSIMNELFIKYPNLLELRKQYAKLRISERKSKDKVEYKKQSEQISNQYNKYLTECLEKENIKDSEINYIPLCEKCKDTGFVGNLEKKYCSCVISTAAQNMLEGSNINNQETLANFNIDIFSNEVLNQSDMSQREMMSKLYDYISKWTSDFPNCIKKQVLLFGSVGLGKSYCLNAIAYEILNKGYSAMMVTSFAINEAAFNEIKNSDSTGLTMMKSVDLLLIDDLGSEKILNNITKPTLFDILNERTRRDLPTIVSSNLSGEQIESIYGLRIFSRLINKERTTMFVLRGKDIRSIN